MNKIDYRSFLEKLGLSFHDLRLLEEAFTHRSYLNEAGKDRRSNERLEFLGDAILSFLISEYLFNTYSEYPEGVLTNIRSTIVKTETLASMAESLELGKYLFLSKGEEKGGGRSNPSLLADTFEALLGSLFVDQGLSAVKNFLSHILIPKVSEIVSRQLNTDYKSRLQELVQEFSPTPPTYKVIKALGPDHAKQFWVTVVVDAKEQEIGTGKSKQEAEQQAAAKTLEKMGKI